MARSRNTFLRALGPASGCLILAACHSDVYSLPVGTETYALSATPPGGALGEAFGATTSPQEMQRVAAQLCPEGYEKLSERQVRFRVDFVQWQIRCRRLAKNVRRQ